MAHDSQPTRTRWKARPTTYNGVKMRSRLEARFAAWMDGQGWEWVYEPECFATDEGQYLPDFEVVAPTPIAVTDDGIRSLAGLRYFIEVKPRSQDHDLTLDRNQSIIHGALGGSAILVGMGHADPEGAQAVHDEAHLPPMPLARKDGGVSLTPTLVMEGRLKDLLQRSWVHCGTCNEVPVWPWEEG